MRMTTPEPPAGHQIGEESAVLAALDRYVHAISARDLRTMAAMQTPDGMAYVARPKEGAGIEIVGRPNSYWVDPARAKGPTLRERYWSPTVLVRGPIAVVWAPYEFWEGCQADSSHQEGRLAHQATQCRMARIAWTRLGGRLTRRARVSTVVRPDRTNPTSDWYQ